MNGNKILEHIKSDCDKKIEEIEIKTAKICSNILAEGKNKAEKIASEIKNNTDKKLKQIKASSKSRTDLEIRNILLNRKRTEIDITLKKTLEYLINMNDCEYFETIYRLAKKLSCKKGDIYLNSRDLSRLPLDFEQKLRAYGLTVNVSKTAADITGGFILKHGDIDENMDFSALIIANQDKLTDLINRELFSE